MPAANSAYVYAAGPDSNYHLPHEHHELISESLPVALVITICIVAFVWVGNQWERRTRQVRRGIVRPRRRRDYLIRLKPS